MIKYLELEVKFIIKNLSEDLNVLSEYEIAILLYRICYIKYTQEEFEEFKTRFFEEYWPSVRKNNGSHIFYALNGNNNIVAMTCLKKTKDEQVICDFDFRDEYTNIGLELLKKSMNFLGTPQPQITLTEKQATQLRPIIEENDWKLTKASELNVPKILCNCETQKVKVRTNKKEDTRQGLNGYNIANIS